MQYIFRKVHVHFSNFHVHSLDLCAVSQLYISIDNLSQCLNEKDETFVFQCFDFPLVYFQVCKNVRKFQLHYLSILG